MPSLEENEQTRLFHNFRSKDEEERRLAIGKIPSIVLESYQSKNPVLDHLILLIYNLNTTSELNYENLKQSNRILVLRKLLRLYVDNIEKPDEDQIKSLVEIIDHVSYSHELLNELAYVFGRYIEMYRDIIDRALDMIRDKAAAHLYSDTLLMVYSVKAEKAIE